MKTTDTELRQLAQDAYQVKGWLNLYVFAKAAVRDLRSWRVPVTSKTGKQIFVRFPRVKLYLKSKLGRLDMSTETNQQDMARIQKRLDPAEFDAFRARFSAMLDGVAHTIEAMSLITCQATGRTGARRFSEPGGWVRTLLPSVAKRLQTAQKRLSSWA